MSTLYTIFLVLHSIIRWLVIIFAVLALVRAYQGWLGRKSWSSMDQRAGLFFTASMDTQLLIGLILYFFLSPITTAGLRNFGGAMSAPDVRFFLLEHSLVMLAAVILAHIGRAFSRRAPTDLARHKRAAIFFTLAFLILLVAIPWPFLPAGRPWIRF